MVVPLLLALLLSVLEFGHYIAFTNALETAAREGARYGSAVGIGDNGLVQFVDCIGIRDAARAKINLVTVDNTDVSVEYDEGPGTAIETFNCNLGPFPAVHDIANGSRILVTIEVMYDPWLGELPVVGELLSSRLVTAVDRRSIYPGNV